MNKNGLFELKPVDIHHFGDVETRKEDIDLTQTWARINPSLDGGFTTIAYIFGPSEDSIF